MLKHTVDVLSHSEVQHVVRIPEKPRTKRCAASKPFERRACISPRGSDPKRLSAPHRAPDAPSQDSKREPWRPRSPRPTTSEPQTATSWPIRKQVPMKRNTDRASLWPCCASGCFLGSGSCLRRRCRALSGTSALHLSWCLLTLGKGWLSKAAHNLLSLKGLAPFDALSSCFIMRCTQRVFMTSCICL